MTKDYVTIVGEESNYLRLIDDNNYIFNFFRIFGLFPISFGSGVFKVHHKTCVISRIFWFIWHLTGMASILAMQKYIQDGCDNIRKNMTNETVDSQITENKLNDCSSDLGDLNFYLIASIGIIMFILVDPVQTIILRRNMIFLPNILKEIKNLEIINLGNQSSKKYKVSKIYFHQKSKRENKGMKSPSTEGLSNVRTNDSSVSTTSEPQSSDINELKSSENLQIPVPDLNNEEIQIPVTDLNTEERLVTEDYAKYYNMIRYVILWSSYLMFFVAFGFGFYESVKAKEIINDIKDEWKFVASFFFLAFPVLTTWFCVFFLGYQRKMYKVINELQNDQFYNEDLIKDIGDYFESMQKISRMLNDKIYKFTFGINFALFVIIGTLCTFELIQGIGEIRKYTWIGFGDIIYVFPIAVCVFHLYLSCQHSSTLVSGQHDKLRYKLKGIMTSLLVDKIEISKENEKKFKRVELLYKNIKDFNPQAEVYGGFKVNYPLFVGMLLFMFTYSRIFYGYVGVPHSELPRNMNSM